MVISAVKGTPATSKSRTEQLETFKRATMAEPVLKEPQLLPITIRIQKETLVQEMKREVRRSMKN